jgi:hypothetical protein
MPQQSEIAQYADFSITQYRTFDLYRQVRRFKPVIILRQTRCIHPYRKWSTFIELAGGQRELILEAQ